ncbi:PilZ domain-containing protein [Pendulispora albinea]|uniref:PilZ domain-containing protein n=1 Tax=Pendulispora albinea TaxID=2741071 RepID=A0ABZ2MCF5_9BACT
MEVIGMGGFLVPVRERKTPRHAVRFDCQVVRERDFKLLGEQAIDLSADGMLVLTDQRVLTGEEVLVSFRVPNLRAWFDAEATVARVVHGRRPGDRGRGALGLRFSRFGRIDSSYVKAGLYRYPPTLPGREPRMDYAESVARIMMGAA